MWYQSYMYKWLSGHFRFWSQNVMGLVTCAAYGPLFSVYAVWCVPSSLHLWASRKPSCSCILWRSVKYHLMLFGSLPVATVSFVTVFLANFNLWHASTVQHSVHCGPAVYRISHDGWRRSGIKTLLLKKLHISCDITACGLFPCVSQLQQTSGVSFLIWISLA